MPPLELVYLRQCLLQIPRSRLCRGNIVNGKNVETQVPSFHSFMQSAICIVPATKTLRLIQAS